jgi:putative FmdB family regulatory protein
MPTYDYVCRACGHEFEHFQSMSDKRLTKCPACKKATLVRKVGAGAGVIFKGTGFYQTDYKAKAQPSSASKEESSKEPAKETTSKDGSSKDGPPAGAASDAKSGAGAASSSSSPPAKEGGGASTPAGGASRGSHGKSGPKT